MDFLVGIHKICHKQEAFVGFLVDKVRGTGRANACQADSKRANVKFASLLSARDGGCAIILANLCGS